LFALARPLIRISILAEIFLIVIRAVFKNVSFKIEINLK